MDKRVVKRELFIFVPIVEQEKVDDVEVGKCEALYDILLLPTNEFYGKIMLVDDEICYWDAVSDIEADELAISMKEMKGLYEFMREIKELKDLQGTYFWDAEGGGK